MFCTRCELKEIRFINVACIETLYCKLVGKYKFIFIYTYLFCPLTLTFLCTFPLGPLV
ncbi:hypothetical protein RchiOBHm_Chr7g0237171 [Rosa chinensis]|uniref:Uncharacterized protein n=1 Tax=Rosa chinensis TaxID=74649 RepID=A0A2P6PH40_ROSCH|nr:hypothetical protein RchiOBHm_Chr7g0237171 [Rosa chinensis]